VIERRSEDLIAVQPNCRVKRGIQRTAMLARPFPIGVLFE
jgi:hypothetical protein